MAPIPTQPGLLPFPGEIRNQIYHHLFDSKDYLLVWPRTSPTNSLPPDTAADLALLRTSKATREEASTVLYAEGHLRYLIDLPAEVQSPLPPFLQAVNLMNKITLQFRSGSEEDIAQICVAAVDMLAETSRSCDERLRIVLQLKNTDAGKWSAGLNFGTSKTMKCIRIVTIDLSNFDTSWKVYYAVERLGTGQEGY